MASVALVGSTGQVGSHIYSVLSTNPAFKTIYAFSRKELPRSEKLSGIVDASSNEWPEKFPKDIPMFISALGTTRAQAGGFDAQRKIDYDLNLALAKAAKAAGTKVYVLISTHGASSGSMFGYTKMKGELEDDVSALDFDHTVIIRPGLIVGQRRAEDVRPPEFVLRKIAGFAGAISGDRLKDGWAQNSDVIAKAAVSAGLQCLNGEDQEKVRVLTQADVVRLGRTEWKF